MNDPKCSHPSCPKARLPADTLCQWHRNMADEFAAAWGTVTRVFDSVSPIKMADVPNNVRPIRGKR